MEFRIQTYLGAVQCLAVVVGTLMTSAAVGTVKLVVKEAYLKNPYDLLPWWIWTLGGYGLFLLAVPALWIILTIREERSGEGRWGKRATLVSGIVMLAGLIWLFGVAALRASL